MSKRGETKFKGPEKDLISTPPEAVLPLLHYLPRKVIFTEPCAGTGDLIEHLQAAGHVCGEAYDLAPRREDIEVGNAVDRIPKHLSVTNPPYSRALLMPILEAAIKWPHPSWWLLPHDVMANKYFRSVAPHAVAIIPIGRVSWIRNTDGSPTGSGFENFDWLCLSNLRTNLIKERL